jgi:UDP-N-acetylglucosamine--N-acetylmuramyl-(pentapeptide) pyrophosphoryl-undecaprenol N-acetylglucosamine transferase
MSNLKLPFKIRTASKVIAAQIKAKDIKAMIVFGGYVSGPAALAASRSGIPLVAHEANSVPGLANRILARRADLVLVAMEPSRRGLKNSIVVGNPLRSSFDDFDRKALRTRARERYGIPVDAAVLAIVGGSLGATALNSIGREIGERSDRNFHILHLTGDAHREEVSRSAETSTNWVVLGFEDEMEYVYAAADVPLPAGKGYQALNAAEIESVGGAVIVDQADSDIVVDLAFEIMADPQRRGEMSTRAATAGRRGAAGTVASMTMELIDA